MKRVFLLTILGFFAFTATFGQKVFSICGDIVDITVNTSNWTVENDPDLFTIKPQGIDEESRLIVMIWQSFDPLAEDAVDAIANEAFDLVEDILADVVWADDIAEFDNNDVYFAALDGAGYYVNDDGSKDRMTTSVMILAPDDVNLLALVFLGTSPAYKKWESELLEIILSIKPTD